MLDYQVFVEGLKEIENTYVNKRFHLSDEQEKQWYKILSQLTNEGFMSAVNEWVYSENNLPCPADIINKAGRLRPLDNSVNIPKNEKHCEICGDTGFMHGRYYNKKMERSYEYVCCCICDMGNWAKEHYPLPQADPNRVSQLKTAIEKNPYKGDDLKSDVKKIIEQMTI